MINLHSEIKKEKVFLLDVAMKNLLTVLVVLVQWEEENHILKQSLQQIEFATSCLRYCKTFTFLSANAALNAHVQLFF